jgi:hypothetical protein
LTTRYKTADVESRIVLLAAESEPAGPTIDRLRRWMRTDVDAERLLRIALREGLSGFLYRSLKRAGALQALGQPYRSHLTSRYYRTMAFNLKLAEALRIILEASQRRQLEVVLLQGISLLDHLYGDPGLRPLSDIDLWVQPADFERFSDCIQACGFTPHALYPHLFKKRDVTIDVHTHLLWAERIGAREVLLDIDQRRIFERAVRSAAEVPRRARLDAWDQFLYLSLHAFKHNVSRLVWLVDLKNWCAGWRDRDWGRLHDRAREAGLEHVVTFTLYLLCRLFDYRPPAGGRRLFESRPLRPMERLVLAGRVHRPSLSSWSSFFLLPAGRPLSQRIEFWVENLFPRPEVLRQVFTGSAHTSDRRLYWKRLRQVVGMVWKRGSECPTSKH